MRPLIIYLLILFCMDGFAQPIRDYSATSNALAYGGTALSKPSSLFSSTSMLPIGHRHIEASITNLYSIHNANMLQISSVLLTHDSKSIGVGIQSAAFNNARFNHFRVGGCMRLQKVLLVGVGFGTQHRRHSTERLKEWNLLSQLSSGLEINKSNQIITNWHFQNSTFTAFQIGYAKHVTPQLTLVFDAEYYTNSPFELSGGIRYCVEQKRASWTFYYGARIQPLMQSFGITKKIKRSTVTLSATRHFLLGTTSSISIQHGLH